MIDTQPRHATISGPEQSARNAPPALNTRSSDKESRMSVADRTTSKKCSKCHAVLPLTAFGIESRRPDGRRCFCRHCGIEYGRSYRNSPGYGERQKRWGRNTRLRAKYGLTQSAFEAMLSSQGGACAICKTTTPSGRHGRFVVDHDHATGKVRGLLCNNCNVSIANLGDCVVGLQRAVDYLAASQAKGGGANG